GGGVSAGEVNRDWPISEKGIAWQLRFWWRLHRIHGPEKIVDAGKLLELEKALWGAAGETRPGRRNGSTAFPCKVLIRVHGWRGLELKAVQELRRLRNKRGEFYKRWRWLQEFVKVSYALFPAIGTTSGDEVTSKPREVALPTLEALVSVDLSGLDDPQRKEEVETVKKEVYAAIDWWASFGGLGGRTRRGLGAVKVERLPAGVADDAVGKAIKHESETREPAWRSLLGAEGFTIIPPVQETDIANFGCRRIVACAQSTSALDAWKRSIELLQNFRQKVYFARDSSYVRNRRGEFDLDSEGNKIPKPGRSRWPEPDAVRLYATHHGARHAPRIAESAIWFPRVGFGAPLQVNFLSDTVAPHYLRNAVRSGCVANLSAEPIPVVIEPEGSSRLASPLILRPLMEINGNEVFFRPGGLLLPCAHIEDLELVMRPESRTAPDKQPWPKGYKLSEKFSLGKGKFFNEPPGQPLPRPLEVVADEQARAGRRRLENVPIALALFVDWFEQQ
ncbi:MAG: hypothetical protein KIT82_23310, partial [Bradyrhizobium sp.]|nr:hypothetical protein [Bradyrhizobium sp.]